MTLSDQLLLAYVDGQLDKPQAAVVSGIMRDDRELAYRISRLQETQLPQEILPGASRDEKRKRPARGLPAPRAPRDPT